MKRIVRTVLSCFLCAILLCAGAPVIQHGFPLLFTADAYTCSDTADCYAKEYADQNDIEFRVCDGSYPEAEPELRIENPSGETETYPFYPLTLKVWAEDLPDGARLVWQADKKNAVTLIPSENGTTCKVEAKWSRTRTANITVKAVDADGNVICESEAVPVRSVGGIQGIFLGLFKRYIRDMLNRPLSTSVLLTLNPVFRP
ncbi:MAG: hypothetical protein ACI4I5_05715 [Acutalibacteraceae bacterium]